MTESPEEAETTLVEGDCLTDADVAALDDAALLRLYSAVMGEMMDRHERRVERPSLGTPHHATIQEADGKLSVSMRAR